MAVSPLVAASRKRLDAAFVRADQLHTADLETQADFAKYLCVLVSGYVEVAVSELAIKHCEQRAAPTVRAYAASQLDRLQNLNAERLLIVMGAFEPTWRTDLESFLVGRRKDALDSVVDLRNKIAHGDSVSVTYSRIKDYYVSVKEIIDFVEQKFN